MMNLNCPSPWDRISIRSTWHQLLISTNMSLTTHLSSQDATYSGRVRRAHLQEYGFPHHTLGPLQFCKHPRLPSKPNANMDSGSTSYVFSYWTQWQKLTLPSDRRTISIFSFPIQTTNGFGWQRQRVDSSFLVWYVPLVRLAHCTCHSWNKGNCLLSF